MRMKMRRSFKNIFEMEQFVFEEEEEEEERNRGGRKQMKMGTTRRNARERNRVRHINSCFEILRQHIPQNKQEQQKKLSKVDTLKSAMIYIENLRQLLQSSSNNIYSEQQSSSSSSFHIPNHIKQEYIYYSQNQEDHSQE